MSDLAATGCMNNDCGCSGNRSGLLGGNDCCSWIWIILLLSCFGNNNGCGSSTFSSGCGCDWLIIILLLSCFGGNNNGCGCC